MSPHVPGSWSPCPAILGRWSLSLIPGISGEVCGGNTVLVTPLTLKNHALRLPRRFLASHLPPRLPAPPGPACASLCRVGAHLMASWLPHLLMETFPCSEVAGTDFLGTGASSAWAGGGGDFLVGGTGSNAQWCQHVGKVSGPENTSKHPNLSEVCFLALFLWL